MEPLDALGAAVGESVTVHLKDGSALDGELAGYDQHMNLVLAGGGGEDTTIIRGDNVVTIDR